MRDISWLMSALQERRATGFRRLPAKRIATPRTHEKAKVSWGAACTRDGARGTQDPDPGGTATHPRLRCPPFSFLVGNLKRLREIARPARGDRRGRRDLGTRIAECHECKMTKAREAAQTRPRLTDTRAIQSSGACSTPARGVVPSQPSCSPEFHLPAEECSSEKAGPNSLDGGPPQRGRSCTHTPRRPRLTGSVKLLKREVSKNFDTRHAFSPSHCSIYRLRELGGRIETGSA